LIDLAAQQRSPTIFYKLSSPVRHGINQVHDGKTFFHDGLDIFCDGKTFFRDGSSLFRAGKPVSKTEIIFSTENKLLFAMKIPESATDKIKNAAEKQTDAAAKTDAALDNILFFDKHCCPVETICGCMGSPNGGGCRPAP
jgi:hypothetical protein